MGEREWPSITQAVSLLPLDHTAVVDCSPPHTLTNSVYRRWDPRCRRRGGWYRTYSVPAYSSTMTGSPLTSRTGTGQCVVTVHRYVVPNIAPGRVKKGVVSQVLGPNIRALVRVLLLRAVRRAVPHDGVPDLPLGYHYQSQGIFSLFQLPASRWAVLVWLMAVLTAACKGESGEETRRWLAEVRVRKVQAFWKQRRGWRGSVTAILPLSKTLVLYRRTPRHSVSPPP